MYCGRGVGGTGCMVGVGGGVGCNMGGGGGRHRRFKFPVRSNGKRVSLSMRGQVQSSSSECCIVQLLISAFEWVSEIPPSWPKEEEERNVQLLDLYRPHRSLA